MEDLWCVIVVVVVYPEKGDQGNGSYLLVAKCIGLLVSLAEIAPGYIE